MADKFKARVEQLLSGTGIILNGSEPHDIQVHNENLYARVLSEGSLGFGEAYMDGWWSSDALADTMTLILGAGVKQKLHPTLGLVVDALHARIANMQTPKRSFKVGEAHYDIGNDLYEAMLDKLMTYTCGYWSAPSAPKTLDEAQEAKLDLICRKIGLRRGQRVLDIGCGWGSFAKFAAEKYGAHVVGVTIAKEQVALGMEKCKGLPVEIRLQDYRSLNEKFDHIVSVGMFEHVGYKNYHEYFKVAARCLKEDGLFLLHTIGSNTSGVSTDPWIAKYIFPNSMLPSVKQIGGAIENLFVMEDLHNFSADYDTTLMHWHQNVEAHWPELAGNKKYDERFHRMWTYYLLVCAASFRTRYNQLWQIVLSPSGVPGGYKTVR